MTVSFVAGERGVDVGPQSRALCPAALGSALLGETLQAVNLCFPIRVLGGEGTGEPGKVCYSRVRREQKYIN